MKIRYFLFILFMPIFLFANESSENSTDIFPRVVNFIIFAAILYYLFADKVKKFFKDRELEIANKLNSIQDKLRESKNEKELAIKKVSEAKESAKSIIETAHKEATLLTNKIKDELNQSIEHLQKGYDERVEVQRSKINKEIVSEIIDELFDSKNFKIDEKDLINIIKKRVA